MGSRFSLSFVCVAMLIAAGCASDTDSAQPVDSSETSEPSSISNSASASTSLEAGPEPTPSTTPEATATATEPTPEATPEVYDWSASLVGGGSIDLAGYANTAVVLWFWSPY
ncbi:MAG: hypothetical protein CL494_00190 [Actinobacteria bacterium]|nr:hypothetical protein [Actinomycetota bacterium]